MSWADVGTAAVTTMAATTARSRAAARKRRVGLHGIGAYRGNPETTAPPALVMGFGNVRERAIEPAIASVADLLS